MFEPVGGLNEVMHIKALAHSKCTVNVGQYRFLIFIIMKLTQAHGKEWKRALSEKQASFPPGTPETTLRA